MKMLLDLYHRNTPIHVTPIMIFSTSVRIFVYQIEFIQSEGLKTRDICNSNLS